MVKVSRACSVASLVSFARPSPRRSRHLTRSHAFSRIPSQSLLAPHDSHLALAPLRFNTVSDASDRVAGTASGGDGARDRSGRRRFAGRAGEAEEGAPRGEIDCRVSSSRLKLVFRNASDLPLPVTCRKHWLDFIFVSEYLASTS